MTIESNEAADPAAGLDDALLSRVDAWRAGRADAPDRDAAIRLLVERGLRDAGSIGLSDGEKLIILMLCSLGSGTQSVVDAQLIKTAVRGGHYWALDWQYPSLFGQHGSSKVEAFYVGRVLEMWSAIEDSFARLGDTDKAEVREAMGKEDATVFPGWDIESEETFMQIARFMTHELRLYSTLKGRADVRATTPTTATHSRMLEAFSPMRQAKGRNLDASDLIALLTAGQAATT